MKKTLSLLLVLAMVLGSFSFAFADEAKVDPAVEAGEFLKKAGVLEGSDSGDLMLDKQLKRQDAVVLLSRLMKAEEEAKKFPVTEEYPTFKDITNNYYKPYLAWAQANKYYEGHNAEKFGYGEFLTAQQYATVLLRALGYEVNDAEAYKAAFETAKKLGIMKDLKVEEKAEITRGQMAQMTFNALGLKMKGSDKTLAEFLGIEMPAPVKLEAKVEDTENLKEVIVKLSNAKLADKEKLENTTNYRLAGNEIERVEVKDNDVLVQVKDSFRSGKQYELQIKGVDKAIDGKYKFVAKDNTIPAVEKVEALGEYGIKVVTTEPIDGARSKNFSVDGKNVTMDVEQYGRTIILTPYNGSFSNKAETLTINELKDFAGFKSAKEDFKIEIAKDEVAPQVVDVLLKGNKVVVVFDKDIYNDTVEAYWNRSNVGNISYELGRHTIYASDADKIDVNKVAYTFKDNEVPSRRDKLTIEGVANHSNVKMEKTSMTAREVFDDSEPEMIDKKVVAKDFDKKTATIKLYFNKNVSGSFIDKAKEEKGFVVKDHFTLYEDQVSKRNISDKGRIVSAKYDYDAKKGEVLKDVIVVELENLEKYDRKENDLEYILEVEGFVDASSARNKMYRDYYEFKFNVVNDLAVSKAVVDKGSKETEITLSFNNYLDREIAEKATNYVFYKVNAKGEKVSSKDVADLEGEAELIGNGTKVLLTIPKAWTDLKYDYAGLKILDVIKDINGNRLGKTYYFDLKSEKLIEENEASVQDLDEAVKAVEKELKDLEVTNATTENDVLTAVKKVITNNKITPTIEAFNKVVANETKAGKITGKVNLTLVDGETKVIKTVAIDRDIPMLQQTLEQAETAVKGVVGTSGSFEATNATTENDVLDAAKKVITNKDITVNMFGFKVTKATKDAPGKVEGNVSLKLGNEEKIVVVDIAIAKLPIPTHIVTVEGDAVVTTDYKIEGAEGAIDLNKVPEGTELTITAVTKIIVNGNKVLANAETTKITIDKDTTITINKAQ